MRKADANAVSNITYAARVFVGMLDNHGPIDLKAAAELLDVEAQDPTNSGFQRLRYSEIVTIIRRVSG